MLLKSTLEGIQIGDPVRSGALTAWPLFPLEDQEPGYDLLADAIAAGTVRISEVSAAGSVPELIAENRGLRHVLIIDGEELIGAKQNRVVNLSILIPAGKTIKIPVSCVEQGRWHSRSAHFASSSYVLHPRARAEKTRQVSRSMERGARAADQSAIWAEVARKSAVLGVASETGAMHDVYVRFESRFQDAVERFAPKPRQVGAAFMLAGRVVGMELFDASRTYSAHSARLVRSYVLDALEVPDENTSFNSDVRNIVEEFLASVSTAKIQPHPAIGAGTDIRFESKTFAGAALELDERAIHLSALATL